MHYLLVRKNQQQNYPKPVLPAEWTDPPAQLRPTESGGPITADVELQGSVPVWTNFIILSWT